MLRPGMALITIMTENKGMNNSQVNLRLSYKDTLKIIVSLRLNLTHGGTKKIQLMHQPQKLMEVPLFTTSKLDLETTSYPRCCMMNKELKMQDMEEQTEKSRVKATIINIKGKQRERTQR